MNKNISFLYHIYKPNSIIDLYTTQPEIAEELSRQGCKTTCVMIAKQKEET